MAKQTTLPVDTTPRPTIQMPKAESGFTGWGPRVRY
jgi:hypothetical protein